MKSNMIGINADNRPNVFLTETGKGFSSRRVTAALGLHVDSPLLNTETSKHESMQLIRRSPRLKDIAKLYNPLFPQPFTEVIEELKLEIPDMNFIADTVSIPAEHIINPFVSKRLREARELLDNKKNKAALEKLDFETDTLPRLLAMRVHSLRGRNLYQLREHVEGLKEYQKALTLMEENDIDFYKYTILYGLAVSQLYLGNLEECNNFYHEALKLEINDSQRAHINWGISLNDFKLAYDRKGEGNDSDFNEKITQSLHSAQVAAELFLKIGEPERIALTQLNLASVEMVLGNNSSARTRLEKVLHEWWETIDETPVNPEAILKLNRYKLPYCANIVSAATNYLALLEHAEGNDVLANNWLAIAYETGKKSFTLRQTDARKTKAIILSDAGNISEAIDTLHEALKILQSTQRYEAQITINRDLIELYRKLNNEEEAIKAEERIRELQEKSK